MNNTRNLNEFGFTEIKKASELLTAYCKNPSILGDGTTIEFNTSSGKVFLIDDDYDVAMLNGSKLELFFTCPMCGHESFLNEIDHNKDNEECQEWIKEIKEANE